MLITLVSEVMAIYTHSRELSVRLGLLSSPCPRSEGPASDAGARVAPDRSTVSGEDVFIRVPVPVHQLRRVASWLAMRWDVPSEVPPGET
jgi:hypothetical protein